MNNGNFRRQTALSLVACLAALAGCGGETAEHEHEKGAFGGFIVSVGEDHYHAEIVIEQPDVLKIFMRGKKDSEVIDIESQTLTAYVRRLDETASVAVELKPEPQTGDQEGKTSLFTGKLPEGSAFTQLFIAVPSISLHGKRYRFHFMTPTDEHGPKMPAKVENAKEKDLYLTAGGLYSDGDIKANGSQTASTKYAKFQSEHDLFPKPGDAVCPITLTKANPKCTWVVNGKTYAFCCPPCIDEFVKLAKTSPEKIGPPESYVKK